MNPAIRAERRDLITAGAIRIIARDGVRALTHRAVDRETGIPHGSTSHHARTRHALLAIVVDALATRSLHDAQRFERTVGDAMRTAPTVDDLAKALATMVESLADRRDDMRARYALILELEDSPDLRARLIGDSELHTQSRRISESALAGAGLPNDSAQIEQLIALADSLVFQRTVIDVDTPVRPILAAYLRGLGSAR